MAPWRLATAYEAVDRWPQIWADMADRGQRRRTWVEDEGGWPREIVERPRRWGWDPSEVEPPPRPALTGLPRRWVVERSIAWIGRDRRLSTAYADLPESRDTMID